MNRSTNRQPFPQTRWSVVLSSQSDESGIRSRALEQICSAYWHPVYAYYRFRGLTPEDAEDLTQGFFAHLLSSDGLRTVQEEKGKLRSFLLVSARNHMNAEWNRQNRKKRGGGAKVFSFDRLDAERRTCLEPIDPVTPEKIFDQHWAMTLLRTAMDRLELAYREEGKERLFVHLKGFLESKQGNPSYRELGRSLEMPENTVRVAVSRMRKRYRALLMEEISGTLEEGGNPTDELHYLFGIFGA